MVSQQHTLQRTLTVALFFLFAVGRSDADDFRTDVQPYLKTYCVKCHNDKLTKGELDFTVYQREANVTAHFRRWNNIIAFIRSGEMPPKGERQPGIEKSNAVVSAVEAILLKQALRNAGDPGVILPRRLSSTEYDLSIKHLTGVDIRPTRDFPADPAGGEGFDNTGEALSMSPNLLKKYLAAAQDVANHMVLKTDGISFAPFPVTSYNERKKLTEQAIIDFYQNRQVDTLEYLAAAWRYRYRVEAKKGVSLERWAIDRGLSTKYLTLVWKTLSESTQRSGFLKELGDAWLAVPAPRGESDRPPELIELFQAVELGRRLLAPPLQALVKASASNWPIQWLDFRAKTAAARGQYSPSNLESHALVNAGRVRPPNEKNPETYSVFVRFGRGFSQPDGYVIVKRPIFSLAQKLPGNQQEEKVDHQVQSLRSVLERHDHTLVGRLGFGKHPAVKGDLNQEPDDAVVHLPFDERTGAEITDAADPDRKGTIHGPASWENGRTGSALMTNGESYVDLGDTTSFDHQSSFSFGCWIKPVGESTGAPLGKMSEADNNRGFFIDSSAGKLQVMLSNEWPQNSIMLNTAEKIAADKWQHVFVTYDGSSKAQGVTVYVDGVGVKTEVVSDTLVSSIRTDAPLLIGRRYTGPKGSPFKGLIDDVRIFNRALTASEVAVLAGTSPASLDPDWFVVKTPVVIEIPLTIQMQRELQGKYLLLPCQLDPKHSKDATALIQHSLDQAPQSRFDSTATHLGYGAAAKDLAESGDTFCNTFPNRFFHVDSERGLAAGFHLVEGFFRDDQPLVDKVLTDHEVVELNRLWLELAFVTQSAETLIRGFVWFERSERHVLHDQRFDFLRPEDPELVKREMFEKFERLYLEKLGVPAKQGVFEPQKPSDKFEMIHGFFQGVWAGLQFQTETLARVEPRALVAVGQLARRAFRRELTEQEQRGLEKLYGKLRADGQSVESSLRGLITAILMSPDFCYRFNDTPSGKDIYPINGEDLASRLSYFLWSSLPDGPLLQAAAGGELHRTETLITHMKRMLNDARIEAFSREFLGQWLRYRDYLSKDPIHAAAFDGYDDALRRAMFEEPVRLATYLIQNDLPITHLLNSDVTFVNARLADHYGDAIAKRYRQARSEWLEDSGARRQRTPEELAAMWMPVSGIKAVGRGGLFGMGVVLTKNSGGQRTSPVKRGFWAVHHLLGQHFPPPPADVPKLPDNERESENTIRTLLAAHVSATQCALCHAHFDSLGLAMEGFDPIGRSRLKDLAGRAIDNLAELPNGKAAKGIPGLIEYVVEHRKQDFVETICRKFLGYALGRSVELSDQPLLNAMQAKLTKNGYRFSVMFEMVVASPQFRRQRGRDFVARRR